MSSTILHSPFSTDEQRELPLAAPPTPTDARWLEDLLRGAHCWMKASDILLSCHGAGLHDRLLRELASSSRKIISGQKGYKHTDHATQEELVHASDWLISQGKKMIRRGIGIRRAAHGRIG